MQVSYSMMYVPMFVNLTFFISTKVHLKSLFFIVINGLNLQDWIYWIWIATYTSF